MDFGAFFGWLIQFWGSLFNFLDTAVIFTGFGVTVSYLDLIGAFTVIFMVVSLFWKGAKA